MSYRTVCKLDLDRRDVELDVADRDRMHKRLMSLFPDGLGDNPRQAINLLFVVDPINGELMLQSDIRPVVGPLNDARNKYFTKVVTKDLSTVGLQFKTGDTIKFTFWFAALKRDTKSTKRIAIESDNAICIKASQILDQAGLNVNGISIIDSQPVESKKRGVAYMNAQLVGTGVVMDAEKLKSAIIKGIGAGRLWGSGVFVVSDIQ